ncbi:MAG: MFS transporter [Aquabacterium sp.]|nr:MFS transporter [Aquabacterium sp.]
MSVSPGPPAERPLLAFGVLWCAYFATIGLFNPYAPLWFKSLGMSTIAIGAIASLQAWTRLLAPYAWSWVADHSGRRVALIRWAAAGALLASIGLFVARWLVGEGPDTGPAADDALLTPALLVSLLIPVLVGLLFVANGGIVPLAESALAQLLTTDQGLDTTRYGRVRMWGSVGFIVAVVAAGALLQPLGIAVFPLLVVLMNATLLAAAWRLPTGHEERHSGEPAPPVLPLLRQGAVRWFFASVFFTVLSHTSLYAFFSLYLDALGYGKQAVGALWAVSVAVEVLFFMTQGRYFGRITPHGWLLLAAGVAALRFAAMAAAGQLLWLLVLAQLTHAITFAGHHAACIALVGRYFPGRLRGRGQALYSALGYGLSGLAGGVGGGWLIDRVGFTGLYVAAAAAALAGLGCAWAASAADRRLAAVHP